MTAMNGRIWQQPRPSPIGDLIERHRAELARIWRRHAVELREAGGTGPAEDEPPRDQP